MMAGCVHVVADPIGFWLGFLIAEITAQLSSIEKEDFLMVKKALGEVPVYAKCFKERVISSLEGHLPYGLSPLKSL